MLSVTIVAAVLAAGGSGSSPTRPQFVAMGAEFFASTAVGQERATLPAPAAGEATGLHWEVSAAGTDDGGGPDSFTLAVTADGVEICSTSIPCTTTGDGSATCTGTFTEGQDLHVEVTASTCATLPAFISSATLRL